MVTESTIDYVKLQQDAMRGIVRAVLAKVAEAEKLPGEHHFFISFATDAPGVGLSKRLKENYPREITIVLQHRFWDLIVGDTRFEVKLTFDGIPERIVVPYSAIRIFLDPSVNFGIQFAEAMGSDDTIDPIDAEAGSSGDQSESLSANGNETPDDPDGDSSSPAHTADNSDEADDENASAQILTLDQFRKK